MHKIDELPGLIEADHSGTGTYPKETRERATWKAFARSGTISVDPAHCDIWEGNTREVDTLDAGSFADLEA